MIKVEDLYNELESEIESSKRASPVAGYILAYVSNFSGVNKLSTLYCSYCHDVKPCHRNYFREVITAAWATFEDENGKTWVDVDEKLGLEHGSL